MYLIEAGHMIISLEHLIMSEDGEKETQPRTLPEGVLRLTVEPGRVIDLRGELAERVRRHLSRALRTDPPAAIRHPSVGETILPGERGEVPGVEGHRE